MPSPRTRTPRAGNPAHRASARALPIVNETSAGGLVVDVQNGQAFTAVIARRNRGGRLEWCLPKGHLEGAETPEAADPIGPATRAPAPAAGATADPVKDYLKQIGKVALLNAEQEVELAKRIEAGLYAEHRLAEEGFGGISGVGQGSPRKPVLAVVKYTPENPKAHVALVGKGITFDTGGNSLKPAASMMTMKCDMAGAASVLSAVVASAELDVPVAVTGYLCLAENMPGGHALRPEDIITMRDGRTVEVLNTDAEGRLVMADGIALASESNPDVILDIATLTGAAMAALGLRTAALLGDEEIRDRVIAAGAAAGEAYWPMPLESYLRKSLESPVADLKNIGSRYGGALTAGLFLKEFVGEGIPWAHLDIAGPAFNEESPYGFTPKEGTGFGTATLVNFIQSYAK